METLSGIESFVRSAENGGFPGRMIYQCGCLYFYEYPHVRMYSFRTVFYFLIILQYLLDRYQSLQSRSFHRD
jgi:hypothetical protein